MEDDLANALCDLDSDSGTPLVSQLLEIQQFAIRQPRSLEWARTLKCLHPVEIVTDEGDTDDTVTVLQEISTSTAAGEYVAVSYRQNESARRDPDDASQYIIASEDAEVYTSSKVSDKILSRILMYMDVLDVPCFWIDQQCIEQEDPIAKEKAVQSMDLVYRCSNHPLGLLTTRIIRQTELDLLHDLISGHLVVDDGSGFQRRIGYATARKLLRLLDRLLRDQWWTRRWIFQEEYCSFSQKKSKIMKLLIPHTIRLRKSQWDRVSRLMHGEVIIDVRQLRTQATLFSRACNSVTMFQKPQEWKMLDIVQAKAKSYSVLHNYPRNLYEQTHCRPMSIQILSDIHYRHVTEAGDTLAILANCCSYNVRLDVHKLEYERKTSLSLAILTQWLLNGEIIWSNTKASLSDNIFGFLRRQTFDEFNPPTDTRQLTFMKKCRFKNVHLSEIGIRTTGHLWRIVDVFPTKSFNLKLQSDLCEDEFKQHCLTYLIAELSKRSYDHLARHLEAYIDNTLQSDIRNRFSLAQIFDQMALNLAEAIVNGKKLTVAQHIYRKSSWAIFVGEWRPTRQSEPLYIFTATEAAQYEKLVEMKRSPDKYVSLLVSADDSESGEPTLFSVEAWINGLAFPGTAKEGDVLFKWPTVLLEENTGSVLNSSEDSEEASY